MTQTLSKTDDGADRAATATLVPERAFVVQFHTQGRFAGRVEHVVSGHATRFRSAAELLAFVRAVLRRPLQK